MSGGKFGAFVETYLKALTEAERCEVVNYLECLTDEQADLVQDTGRLFYRSSAVNGTWFWRTFPILAKELNEAELKTWLAEGAMISRGSWECGLSFLKASPEILQVVDKAVFLKWMQIGRILVRYSNHDANWYFKNSDTILAKLERAEQQLLTGWALKILDSSWQATVACFKAWPEINRCLESGTKEKVLESGCALATDFPDDAGAFFIVVPAIIRKTGDEFLDKWIDAAYLIQNGQRGVVAAFFRSSPGLVEKTDKSELEEIISQAALLGKRLSLTESGVAIAFYETLTQVLRNLEWPEINEWVVLIEEVSRKYSTEGALEFIKNSPEALRQLDIKELAEWVGYGLENIKNDQKLAYFMLKSQESRDAVSRFRSGLYLESVKKVLMFYCEGLTGESLVIRNTSDLPRQIHGDDRLFGTLDTRRVYLPDVVKLFDNERDNLRFYRVMMMHMAAHRQYGTFVLSKEEIREMALNPFLGLIFEYIEDSRVDYLAAKNHPGMHRDMRIMVDKEIRENTGKGTAKDILYFLKFWLWCDEINLKGLAPDQVAAEIEEFWDKVKETGASAKESLLLARRLVKTLPDGHTCLSRNPRENNLKYRGRLKFDLVYLAFEVDEELEEGQGSGGNRNNGIFDDGEQALYEEPGVIPDEQVIDFNSDFYLWLKKLLYAFYEDEENPYRMIAYYDEWDRTLNDYKKDWCKVREILLKPSTGRFVTQTLEEHYGMISTLKRFFGMLRPDRFQRYRRQEDGEDVDIDAVIEAMVEKRAGVSPAGGFYIRRDKRERDVAVGFLLDLSYSTEEVIAETGKTLLDVEKEAVIVMAEALEVLGDKYAIYGFTSDRRDKINFYVIKDFDEPYTPEVKQRFGGLQSYGMTRLAAAIRHAVFKMEMVQAAIKILIILSDGRPFDFDYNSGLTEDYEEFYPETDTRMALREAKMRGVNPFCITVDSKGKEYLEYIFGNVSYIIIDDVQALPTKLTETYKNLTT